MIWVLGGIFILGAFLLAFAPLYSVKVQDVQNLEELKSYARTLERLEREIAADPENASDFKAERTRLQRKMLEAKDGVTAGPRSKPAVLLGLLAIVAFSTFVIYKYVGAPDLTVAGALSGDIPQSADTDATPAQALADLERRLAANPEDQTTLLIYARTLILMGRHEDGIAAYERLLNISDTPEDIRAEFDAAKLFIERQTASATGPSAEQIAAFESMSEDDRDVMINAMVSSLAARLRENPDDADGWIRLLRSRRVLEQTQQARDDIAFLTEALSEEPELVQYILLTAGWSDPQE